VPAVAAGLAPNDSLLNVYTLEQRLVVPADVGLLLEAKIGVLDANRQLADAAVGQQRLGAAGAYIDEYLLVQAQHGAEFATLGCGKLA